MIGIRYYLAAVAAFTIWGSLSLALRPLSAYPAVDILFYRVFSCAILMLLIVVLGMRQTWAWHITLFRPLPHESEKTIVLVNLGGSLFLGTNWFSFIYVVNHVSVKATSLAYLLCPVLTSLLAYLALGEKLTRWQWLSLAVSSTGCLVLSYRNPTALFAGLIIGFSYACYLVSQRQNVGFDKFIALTVQIVILAIVLLPFYGFCAGPLPVSYHFYVFIAIIAVVYTILPLWLNLYALQGLGVSTIGMFLNINPIIAFGLATVVYHELLNPWQLMVDGLVFFAMVIFNVYS